MAVSKYDIDIDLANRAGTSHAYLVELVGSNKRVLDVGCDTGYLGEALNTRGNVTTGFEYNQVSAAEARKRLARVEIGDLESSDLVELFGRASFDIVVFGDVLEHLRDPLRVLRQARGLLAPGGSVLISVPNIAHGDVRLALLRGRFNYTQVGLLDDTHTRFFTRDSLVTFLQDAGFVLVELRRTVAELFTTEVGVTEADFDPAIVAQLRADPEATTYQFVLRAVPDDAAEITSEQAVRTYELAEQLAVARRHVDELSAERDALQGRLQDLEALRQADIMRLEAERDAALQDAPTMLARLSRLLARAARWADRRAG
jgi:2-polyprenyl-3-methyl-5-hydroxy-6-metoxy-1,4-benzoquinol methylase